MADAPGPLIGRGRATDVFDLGDGRVLRRYRRPHAPERLAGEVAAMRHLAAHGFPVPVVHDVDGGDVVMERLTGRTLLQAMQRRPWRYRGDVDVWADLQRRLGEIPVDGLAGVLATRFGPATSVLHLDLHPENIMLTPHGPVVFDWTNVAVGPAAADVAQSWLVAASSTVDAVRPVAAVVAVLRRRVVERFVARCGRDAAAALLPVVAEERLRDPNVRPEEAARVRALVAAVAGTASAPSGPGRSGGEPTKR